MSVETKDTLTNNVTPSHNTAITSRRRERKVVQPEVMIASTMNLAQRASRVAKVTPSVRHAVRNLILIFSTVRPSNAVMNRKKTTHAHLIQALDGVLASPLSGCRFVPGSVGLVDVCNLGDKRVVRVGVCQHRADAQ